MIGTGAPNLKPALRWCRTVGVSGCTEYQDIVLCKGFAPGGVLESSGIE